MSILDVCRWLETTGAASIVRRSAYGFQIVAGLHIIGLAFSVGTLLWFDLRLLGVSLRQCSISEVYRRLAPLTLGGFVLMAVTGAWLLSGFATKAYGNTAFRIKLTALVLAGLNALVFHLLTERDRASWDQSPRPPLAAQAAGLISLVLWAIVIICGRTMSYTMF
jgi:hypothetical protein